MELKHCMCGCGTVLSNINNSYISGHNGRKYPIIITEEIAIKNKVICRCGCNTVIPFKLCHLKRKPKFIQGHNGKLLVHTLESRQKIGDAQRGKPSKNKGCKKTEESKRIMSRKMKYLRNTFPEKFINSSHNGFEKLWKNEEFKKKNLELLKSKDFIKKCLGRRPMSSLEIKFNDIINKFSLPYKFVGNGTFFIERKNPDFINVNGEKIAIEVFFRKHKCIVSTKEKFGISYDENKLNEWKQSREKIFNEYGWNILFFDETQVNDKCILEKLGGDKMDNHINNNMGGGENFI
jgi:hypothetical protein